MSRVPWDDLPGTWKRKNNEQHHARSEVTVAVPNDAPIARNYVQELESIGKRIIFGAICGTIAGASFGFVDVLRDGKIMTSKSKIASAKIIKYSLSFGGMFAFYQGTRKFLKFNVPLSGEENVLTSSIITLAPMVVSPYLRGLIPYGVLLILIDAFNGINDI